MGFLSLNCGPITTVASVLQVAYVLHFSIRARSIKKGCKWRSAKKRSVAWFCVEVRDMVVVGGLQVW